MNDYDPNRIGLRIKLRVVMLVCMIGLFSSFAMFTQDMPYTAILSGLIYSTCIIFAFLKSMTLSGSNRLTNCRQVTVLGR